jgi:hypothetical protein
VREKGEIIRTGQLPPSPFDFGAIVALIDVAHVASSEQLQDVSDLSGCARRHAQMQVIRHQHVCAVERRRAARECLWEISDPYAGKRTLTPVFPFPRLPSMHMEWSVHCAPRALAQSA